MQVIKNLSEILDQGPAINLLKNSLERNRLSHAYLFTGPKGVGKETTAQALLFHVLCLENVLNPCGNCLGCKKLIKSVHPDVYKITPEKKEITIHQIREINNFLKYRPLEGKFKLILIKNAEKMNLEASNALLKSLEEPPPYAIFILITENSTQLLPTIVSRSQIVRFRPLSKKSVLKMLTDRFGFDRIVAETLAEISQGSLGRALKIAEKGFLEDLNSFVKAGFSKNAYLRFKVAERLSNYTSEDLEDIFYLILTWIWRSYLSKKAGVPYPQAFPEEVYPYEPSKAFPLIYESYTAIERYLNPELVFYRLILKLFD